jgi:uncharacterized protein (TIGR00725 family)
MDNSAIRVQPRPPFYVAVVGPGDDAGPEKMATARRVGGLLAEHGVILVCGGLTGVMAAGCEGAASQGGLTVGLLPGRNRSAGNAHLSVVLPTGLGELRNGLIVAACDAVIAIGGRRGTLSEIALAARTGKPVIAMDGWTVHDQAGQALITRDCARSPEQAVAQALALTASGERQ